LFDAVINKKKSQIIRAIFFLVLGGAAVFGLSAFLERSRPSIPLGAEDEDLAFQTKALKGFSFGAEGLMADIYWIRALQYIGDKSLQSGEKVDIENLRPLNPRLLYPLLDSATDMDPHFLAAYNYGAVVLPAIDVKQAVSLAQKGIDNNPDEWRLYQHLGFIYWRSNDFQKAAEVYDRGGAIAGAPSWMRFMSVRMKTEGSSRETARSTYEQMLAVADDEQIKATAQRRLVQIDSLDERDAVDKVLQIFREKNNRCAANWREILTLLVNVKLAHQPGLRVDGTSNIVDPGGTPYILNREKCVAELDTAKTRIPVE
jgi:tetratricopeptide (TPR) repeat protein